MIRVQIDIHDDDAITFAEAVHLFAEDREATEFLEDIYSSKMQRIFDRLRAGAYDPSKLIHGPYEKHTAADPNGGYTYDNEGKVVPLVYKTELYEKASAACFERTKVTITHEKRN